MMLVLLQRAIPVRCHVACPLASDLKNKGNIFSRIIMITTMSTNIITIHTINFIFMIYWDVVQSRLQVFGWRYIDS
jgi:hypothetical protein